MDHTQRRLIHEGLELAKEQLFEKHPDKPGQYRLAVDPANVRFTPALREAPDQDIAATSRDAGFLGIIALG